MVGFLKLITKMNKQEFTNVLIENGIISPDPSRPGKYSMSLLPSNQNFEIPKIKRLKPRTINITGTAATELFAALPGKINIITEILVMNAHPDTATLVEIREHNASGALLWKGVAANNGGGFNQPLKTYIEQPTTNRKIVAVCLTDATTVSVSAAGVTN